MNSHWRDALYSGLADTRDKFTLLRNRFIISPMACQLFRVLPVPAVRLRKTDAMGTLGNAFNGLVLLTLVTPAFRLHRLTQTTDPDADTTCRFPCSAETCCAACSDRL